MTDESEVTRLLGAIGRGDGEAFPQLIQILQTQLRTLAGHLMHGERVDHTLQPTALVNEAFMKLARNSESQWNDRRHFMAAAAQAMRSILVDHARSKRTQKRASAGVAVDLDRIELHPSISHADIIDLDSALSSLGERYPRAAEVVELRVFGGMTVDEVARHLEIAPRSVKRRWALAQSWLLRALKDDTVDPSGGRY